MTTPTTTEDTRQDVDAAVAVALASPRAQTLSLPRHLTGDAYRQALRQLEAAHLAEARRYRRRFRRRK